MVLSFRFQTDPSTLFHFSNNIEHHLGALLTVHTHAPFPDAHNSIKTWMNELTSVLLGCLICEMNIPTLVGLLDVKVKTDVKTVEGQLKAWSLFLLEAKEILLWGSFWGLSRHRFKLQILVLSVPTKKGGGLWITAVRVRRAWEQCIIGGKWPYPISQHPFQGKDQEPCWESLLFVHGS